MLWNVRLRASPTQNLKITPHFSEPALALNPDHAVNTITLVFTPDSHAHTVWAIVARARSEHDVLTVDDVLRAVSTALFQRSMCPALSARGPHAAEIEHARGVRAAPVHTGAPHREEGCRNVDLYRADRGRALYFRGLRAERLRDGALVYVVRLEQA